MVARCNGVAEVGGSNPLGPTISPLSGSCWKDPGGAGVEPLTCAARRGSRSAQRGAPSQGGRPRWPPARRVDVRGRAPLGAPPRPLDLAWACLGGSRVFVAAVSSWRQCLRRSGRSGVSEGRARSTARSPLGSIGVRPAEPPRSHGSEQREVGRSARGSQATGAARGRCGPTRCTSAPTPRRRPMLASRTLSQ